MNATAIKQYCHYTRMGVSISPPCADGEGYVEYREGYEKLPPEKWTAGERWISAHTARVNDWRATTR